jgi:diguanylate cyclase (GGDEF)-like protein
VERNDRPALAIGLSLGALTRRLMVGVIIAGAVLAVTHRLAIDLFGADAVSALAVASALALGIATAALALIIRPVVLTQARLQERYAAAVADSLRDPLTGLGNHRAFHEELDRQVAEAQRYQVPVALMLIDLDEFKAVNDGRGHAAGDRVLRSFGQLLAAGIRRVDRAFRVGGDEFAILLPHTDVEAARVVARRLLAEALQPSLRGEDLDPISFSGGISALPELADTQSRLYSQADSALYAAKRGGRTDIVAFDPADQDTAADGQTTSMALAEVLARGQLRAVYQPIVALASGQVIGVEGLIRPVAPAPFADPAALFAAAEASGRLTALDLACVELAVAGAATLAPGRFLSVNLSPSTLEAPEFSAATLLSILSRHEFSPDRLVVELTEHQPIADLERVRQRLDLCRRAGVRIAADDIGAGNSGLRLMADIAFDVLKVDVSLVQRSSGGGSAGAVLGSVVEIAARTGALVIAEGIEHASQLPPLTAYGITAGQGYHLGEPGPLLDGVPAIAPAAIGMAAWRQTMGLGSVN